VSLPHAILGFLQQQPLTGYDLKTRCFDVSVAKFWPADQAQIYRTLDRLEEQGWTASHMEIQQSRPNRKIYQITDAGRAELARWLVTPQPLPIHREPFLVQLYFAAGLGKETILSRLEEQMEAHKTQLRSYQETPGPPPQATGDRAAALAALTLDLGLCSEQMYLDWLDHAIEQVRTLPEEEVILDVTVMP